MFASILTSSLEKFIILKIERRSICRRIPFRPTSGEQNFKYKTLPLDHRILQFAQRNIKLTLLKSLRCIISK